MVSTHSHSAITMKARIFAEQKLVRGDAGNVDLEDCLLLAFLRHGQRGQQRRKHGYAQNEDARAVELLGIRGRGCTRGGSAARTGRAGRRR